MKVEKKRETSWTYHVGDEVLQRVKEESNSLETIKRRKSNWIGHKLRMKQEVLHRVKEEVIKLYPTCSHNK